MSLYPKPNAKLQSRAGFTLVELLVVIGIIALLISILLPTLSRARESAKTIACASQIRQIGLAAFSFANDRDNTLPYGLSSDRADWGLGNDTTTPFNYVTMRTQLAQYLGSSDSGEWEFGTTAPEGIEGGVWECPSTDSLMVGMNGHYGWNYVAMPSPLEEFNPAIGTGVEPGDTIRPAKLNRLFGSETALFWDSPAFSGSEVIDQDDGTMNLYRAWNGMDFFNLMDPSQPELRYWTDPELDINQFDPDLGPEFPVSIIDHPTIEGLSQFGKEQYAPDGSVFIIMYGAPQFRHGQSDRTNVAFSDGSVRAQQGFQRQRHPVDEDNFAISELQRRNIRIKWPSRLITP